MDLIYIYGPPAVGKLTVAKDLAESTRYKLLHNHLTVDLVSAFFEFPSETANRLSDKFRLEMFEEAAKAGLKGIIFTFVYGGSEDDDFVKQVTKSLEVYGVRVCFVQLTCSQDELFKRVQHESRDEYQKITTQQTLKKVLENRQVLSSIPYVKNLTIDNTDISPSDVVKRIIDHYNLSNIVAKARKVA